VALGEQQFRADLALNCWCLGMQMLDIDDWSIHVGPIDIECEYGKFYDDDDKSVGAAHVRRFSKVREPCECEFDRRLDDDPITHELLGPGSAACPTSDSQMSQPKRAGGHAGGAGRGSGDADEPVGHAGANGYGAR
jgi:hypothetical protein